jgi:hypothetical protein
MPEGTQRLPQFDTYTAHEIAMHRGSFAFHHQGVPLVGIVPGPIRADIKWYHRQREYARGFITLLADLPRGDKCLQRIHASLDVVDLDIVNADKESVRSRIHLPVIMSDGVPLVIGNGRASGNSRMNKQKEIMLAYIDAIRLLPKCKARLHEYRESIGVFPEFER